METSQKNENIKNPKEKNTYLGQKGYTLLKKDLSPDEEKLLRTELTVRPYVPGSPANNTAKTFPVYRESANKFYVPRYFGEEHFGVAKEIKIPEGNNISLEFSGELREHQHAPVNSYLEYVAKNNGGGSLLDLPCAFGKTSLSLYILSKLKKKALVLVHKEFLFNQWIERIKQFLPEARIGKIQGPTIDIEDKDIVLGMIQSISMKEYPSNIFESFGLTIIDEVHHISSEVFSNTLFKLVTKYMLGLSATMNRKDGTSKVFKMFLGEVVFKDKRKQEHSVVVRGIEYKTKDDDFNEIVYDYRGNPQFSTMITKLCEYNRRSEFILLVLSDMLKENPNQQIMILAHNKSLLKYLYDAIYARNIATVGYYVGGMKEAALKESESKKVIIATYAMAAEGLDIKSLTTLIMATPKTDIEQSVGRILREKHSQPVVVDIIDSHELFNKQWLKRKAFYKKQNYKIVYADNSSYCGVNQTAWITLYDANVACDEKSKQYKKLATVLEKDNLLQGKCLININKK
jgi:superfamily II DNA or RNA helicase